MAEASPKVSVRGGILTEEVPLNAFPHRPVLHVRKLPPPGQIGDYEVINGYIGSFQVIGGGSDFESQAAFFKSSQLRLAMRFADLGAQSVCGHSRSVFRAALVRRVPSRMTVEVFIDVALKQWDSKQPTWTIFEALRVPARNAPADNAVGGGTSCLVVGPCCHPCCH
jgi:hypothetical protein